MLLVVCQLSRDVIGYMKTRNVIGAFRSVYCESQLNSRLLLVKLPVVQSFSRGYFCLIPSISRLYGAGDSQQLQNFPL